MTRIDLAIAWNWEFDREFVLSIERGCSLKGLATWRVEDHDLAETVRLLSGDGFRIGAFLDRASDADERYRRPAVRRYAAGALFQPAPVVLHAADKATMHLELITHGVYVPNTIILAPVSRQRELDLGQADLERIGIPFVIKPANTTGGGTGVILNASTLARIDEARTNHPDDKYLVQETIHPTLLGGRRAWFRAYHAFGMTILCWWDDITHQYTEVTPRGGRSLTAPPSRDHLPRRRLDFSSSNHHPERCSSSDYVTSSHADESLHENKSDARCVHRRGWPNGWRSTRLPGDGTMTEEWLTNLDRPARAEISG